VLGCSPWVNDDKLIGAIEALPGACIVISKHPRTAGGKAGADRLREVNERTNGRPAGTARRSAGARAVGVGTFHASP
jgi:hypothetical protein